MGEKRGQVLPWTDGDNDLCLVSLEMSYASSEFLGQGRSLLEILIADLSDARRWSRRSFFAVQRHTLAESRVPLVMPWAILEAAGVETPWWFSKRQGYVNRSNCGTWSFSQC
jgi:hypothetical protein